jgi:hypothetical protein
MMKRERDELTTSSERMGRCAISTIFLQLFGTTAI